MKMYFSNDQRRRLSHASAGYTLLEILLVLAIIATISVFSVGIYQQQMTSFRVDKTALQMQQWLEAAKAYYVVNAKWPDPTNVAGCTTANAILEGTCVDPPMVYIKAGSIDTNSWGEGFKLTAPDPKNSAIFAVETTIPTLAKPGQAEVIAQRIAGHLPNASVSTANGVTVTASVTVPGTASNSNSNQVILKSISDVQCNTGTATAGNCQMPLMPTDCPSGTAPAMHVALQNFQPDPDGIATSIKTVKVGPINYAAGEPWPAPNLLINNSMKFNSKGSILVIITCEPANTTKTIATQKNIFSY